MSLRFEGCVLDLDRYEVRRGSVPVALEPQAMRILIELVTHRDRVVEKTELLDTVWGDRFVSESALTTQIKELRRALGDTGRDQHIIRTVHGRGYMFVAVVEEDAEGESETPLSHPVIAVLPFSSLGGGAENAHIAQGLTHDVIAALSKHRWLHVLARGPAAAFAGAPDAATRLREQLGVDYVVEGAVRTIGGRLRVTASLSATASGVYRWAEKYDRPLEDLFEVLDELTDLIVATVEPEVGYAERARVSRRAHADLRAWDLFHLGLDHFYRFTAEDNEEAQRLLARSRELDPEFADAHAWWAYARVLGMVYWDTEPTPEALDDALAATQRALSLDSQNAVFHMLRGRVQLARRDYDSALLENRRAVELNSSFAAAYCGLGDSLCYEGRYEEAIDQFARSVALGAHDPQRWAFLSYGALALIFAGRYEEAVVWADEAAALPNCQYWTLAHKVVALARMGRLTEAAAAVDRLLKVCPQFSLEYARSKLFYLKRPEQLEIYLGGLAEAGVPPADDRPASFAAPVSG
jgi:TolB-like protein/Tfp pilus assembly protein PilF